MADKMIKLSNIKIPAAEGRGSLKKYAAKSLGVKPDDISELVILKESVDSRKKSDVHFVYTVAVTLKKGVRPRVKTETYTMTELPPTMRVSPPDDRPVVVGMGPAGLFAALTLAESGVPCTVIERGQPVDVRTEDVSRFWRTGQLDTESNVQFGEGGAGTFSDGKLTTGTNDRRIGYVFRRFVDFGAPEDILYASKPHIGTDKLKNVVKNIRNRLISWDAIFGSAKS